MVKLLKIILSINILVLNLNVYSANIKSNIRTIKTLYGKFVINEPLILEMLAHPYMKRLKKVRQYGVDYYLRDSYEYTRYDHSVGVFALLRRFNAPLVEQASGLYHDISHTAFSHLGDFLFDSKSDKDSYQDRIHAEFLYKAQVDKLLEKYGLSVEDILHKQDKFKMLEQSIPNICADRLEYNLNGAYLEGFLNQQDINLILTDLRFKNGNWFFVNIDSAKKFAQVPLYLMKKVWGTEQNFLINSWAAQAIKIAIDKKVIDIDDIKYSTDDKIWNKLISIQDSEISNLLNKVRNVSNYYKFGSLQDHDLFIKNKFRGIDPFVKIDNKLVRLSDIDMEFKNQFDQAKKEMEQGCYVKFTDI